MRFPTEEQQRALCEFYKPHPWNWKARLRNVWNNGYDDTRPLLRQLRNQFGPVWLMEQCPKDPAKLRIQQIQIVADHYIIAAIWADKPEGTNPRPTNATKKTAFRQCEQFIADCGPLFQEAMDRFDDGYGSHPDAGSAEAAFGHDYWLTRNGHGVGFWDRKELDENGLGDKLTALCHHKEANYDFYNGWFHLYK